MANQFDWEPMQQPVVIGNASAGEIVVPLTVGMRGRMNKLLDYGIYGTSLEEMAERFICERLWEITSKRGE